MKTVFSGQVKKMKADYGNPVQYSLAGLDLNDLIGREIEIISATDKSCIHCNRSIKKTFGQGYCFPCSQSLARCDMCILRPERCHFDTGTCREPDWGQENCMIDHTIYLARTSSVKVGITRTHQKITRWMDQGALSALPIGTVPTRKESGLVEIAVKKRLSDKTNWRTILTGKDNPTDLYSLREEIHHEFPELIESHGGVKDTSSKTTDFTYPVDSYLEKAKSGNLDKTPKIAGRLNGIRGQYLLLGEVGINVRKYQGYHWTINC